MKLGDRNTRFFHVAVATMKASRQRIGYLRREDGTTIADQLEIQHAFLNHFHKIFKPLEVGDLNSNAYPSNFQLLSAITCKIIDDQRTKLDSPFMEIEIRDAIFAIGGLKVPGPDGMITAFYRKHWDIVGALVTLSVLSFLNTGQMLKEVNQSYIAQIPKTKAPQTVNDYRPISLCNIVYKVISKVLANRIRMVLLDLIDLSQNAFVSGRLILDNILIAHELLEFIWKRTGGKKSYLALKLDMNKVYDRVNWDFLWHILEIIGFSHRWLHSIF